MTKLVMKLEEVCRDPEVQYFGVMIPENGRWNYRVNYRTFFDENVLVGLSVGAYMSGQVAAKHITDLS